MSHQQLEQLRLKLDGLVAEIEQREEEFLTERSQLGNWADELKARELRLEAEAAAHQSRQASDNELARRVEQLTTVVQHLFDADSQREHVSPEQLADQVARQVQERLESTIQSVLKHHLSPILSGLTSAPTTTKANDVDRAVQQGLRRELTATTAERDRLKQELIELEALLNEAMEGNALPELEASSRSTLLEELAASKAEQARLAEALAEATSAAAAVRDEEQTQLLAMQAEVETLRELLKNATDGAAAQTLQSAIDISNAEAIDEAAQESLREQLERAECEIIDLRTKKEELEEQVSQLQVCTAPHGHMPHLGTEGLTWEERKRLLIMQLNAEDDDDEEAQRAKFDVQDVIASTEYEIGKRDREIAELRELLAQQAEAQSGLAVGAAAVAEMIESDELIQQEREKLREIQHSWEEKLRQAEIDLSMERAKLARERSQLEEKLKELEALNISEEVREELAVSKERRWLKRLGLRDEK